MKEVRVKIKDNSKYRPGLVGTLKEINKKYNTGMVYSESGKNPYRVVVSLDDIIYL